MLFTEMIAEERNAEEIGAMGKERTRECGGQAAGHLPHQDHTFVSQDQVQIFL